MPEACNFIKKETLAQVFSCEFCEISKNNFFTEHLWTTASEVIALDWDQYATFGYMDWLMFLFNFQLVLMIMKNVLK